MLYNFFNILTLTVIICAVTLVAIGIIILLVLSFLELDSHDMFVVILIMILASSLFFQLYKFLTAPIKRQETEQHKINN